jgi:hypothetical protein
MCVASTGALLATFAFCATVGLCSKADAKTLNHKPESQNLKLEIRNLKPDTETQNLKPET